MRVAQVSAAVRWLAPSTPSAGEVAPGSLATTVRGTVREDEGTSPQVAHRNPSALGPGTARQAKDLNEREEMVQECHISLELPKAIGRLRVMFLAAMVLNI